MSDAKLVNIDGLMTTYNFEIEQLPDNLKCAQCKLVLKDACHLPCCCRYCRVCIDNLMERGGEFCSGKSEECGKSFLSRFQSDYLANKGVSRLTVKCPHDGCVHESQLANIEEHLRECPWKREECPFRELGCTQDKLCADEMGGHFQYMNRRHNEILIGIIANINREIEILKKRDKAHSGEIEILKKRDKAHSGEINTLKNGLMLKDEQIRSMWEQMVHVQNENKSIENDMKLIKEENEDLADQVRILTEEIEREITERRENDELDSARVIDHVDREIAAVTLLIGSNNDKLVSEIESVKGNIISINQDVQSIKDNTCYVKSQVQSGQALVELGQVDASFMCLIDITVGMTDRLFGYGFRLSDYFSGEVHPYKYRLKSENRDTGTAAVELCIYLRIYADTNDWQLTWPFRARVVITVTDRDRCEACKKLSRQCRIERPLDNGYRESDPFRFLHPELIKVGLNLSRDVRVSCVIIPGAG